MKPLTLDGDFLSLVRTAFPKAAYSCSPERRRSYELPLSPREWTTRNAPGRSLTEIKAALVGQVGPEWEGAGSLSPVRRGLVHLLAASSVGVDVSQILEDLNAWALGDAEDEALEDLVSHEFVLEAAGPVVERVSTRHAFESTVILQVVAEAKNGFGVFPSSELLWVRGKDRLLWLLLNGYGRPNPVPEIVGITTHHTCERHMKRPLTHLAFGSLPNYLLGTLPCT